MIALEIVFYFFCFEIFQLRCFFLNVCHFKALILADGATLCDDNFVAQSKLEIIGVRHKFLASAEALAVRFVHHVAMYRDNHGVLHFGRCDDSCLGSHEEGKRRQ